MTSKSPSYAIALYRSKIEFYEKKLDTIWKRVDRFETEDLSEDQIAGKFRARTKSLTANERNITLWLTPHICHRYSSKTAIDDEEIKRRFFEDDRVDGHDAVRFAEENFKKNKFEYLVIEKLFWEEASHFIEAFELKIHTVGRAPNSSTFPMPKEFDPESLIFLSHSDAKVEPEQNEEPAENLVTSDAQDAQSEPEEDVTTSSDTAEEAEQALEETQDAAQVEESVETAVQNVDAETIEAETQASSAKKKKKEKPPEAKITEGDDAAQADADEEVEDKNQAAASVDASAPAKEQGTEDAPEKKQTSKLGVPLIASVIIILAMVGGFLLYQNWPSDDPSAQTPDAEQSAAQDITDEAEADEALASEEDAASDEVESAEQEDIATAEEDDGISIPPPRDEEKIAAIKKRIDAQNQISGAGGGGVSTSSTDGNVNLENLTLLGIFGATGKPQAMIRAPSGDVYTVKKGSTVNGWSIVAISRDEVIITKGSNQLRLKVPN